MKCKRCDGDGVIIYYDYQYADKEVCPDCDGNGVVEPLTEQEWLQTATTEQLAEFLCNVAVTDVLWDKIRQPYYTDGKQAVVEWLKQPHSEVGK